MPTTNNRPAVKLDDREFAEFAEIADKHDISQITVSSIKEI